MVGWRGHGRKKSKADSLGKHCVLYPSRPPNHLLQTNVTLSPRDVLHLLDSPPLHNTQTPG